MVTPIKRGEQLLENNGVQQSFCQVATNSNPDMVFFNREAEGKC